MNLEFIILLAIASILVYFLASLLSLWFQALFSKANVSFFQILGMRLRKVDPKVIIYASSFCVRRGIPIEIDLLEAHYLSGGNVERTVNAYISASIANLNLSFQHCAAIDLSGKDVLENVQEYIRSGNYLKDRNF